MISESDILLEEATPQGEIYMSINHVVLTGRMTRDPDLRRTGSGKAVTSFTLAVDKAYSSDGEQSADFIPCVVWNKPAENVAKYCSKGSKVGVDGRLSHRTYDNAQGQKVNVVEVVCSHVEFLESRPKSTQDAPAQGVQAQQYQNGFNQDQQFSQPQFDINQPVNLEQEFDNSANHFNIMDDQLPF